MAHDEEDQDHKHTTKKDYHKKTRKKNRKKKDRKKSRHRHGLPSPVPTKPINSSTTTQRAIASSVEHENVSVQGVSRSQLPPESDLGSLVPQKTLDNALNITQTQCQQ
ncbi:hypothetical protein G6F47_004791 [Rhizopus delemar]|nr:hypothetical protein G6F43_010453 [Rhizopus delemar]KAG1493984.1 hypothetical protein G6F54_008198 [Rhizopus delemar]KAG1508124.1 hypothetical protein G6F53_008430 [Rhizopus delemar]KAG1523534.1 hypothetical protein G6F52_004946 [Rhizopus delemar]KAG1554882.1 hypothetical protein G6F49_007638 [Rhizopus delemar]